MRNDTEVTAHRATEASRRTLGCTWSAVEAIGGREERNDFLKNYSGCFVRKRLQGHKKSSRESSPFNLGRLTDCSTLYAKS